MTIENETCALCGVTIYAGTTSFSGKRKHGKHYCSSTCADYDSWPTREEYIKHLKEDG